MPDSERILLDHANIVVTDMERSLEFYRSLLGLEQRWEGVLAGEWIDAVTGQTGVEARCVFLQSPDTTVRIELLEYKHPVADALPPNSLPHVPGVRHLAFQVPDLEAFCDRARAAGVPFVSGPITVPFPLPGGLRKRLCYFHDPDGVLLEAAEYRSG